MRTVKSQQIESWIQNFRVKWMLEKGHLLFVNEAGQKIVAVCDLCNIPLGTQDIEEATLGSRGQNVELFCPMGHGEMTITLPTKRKKKEKTKIEPNEL